MQKVMVQNLGSEYPHFISFLLHVIECKYTFVVKCMYETQNHTAAYQQCSTFLWITSNVNILQLQLHLLFHPLLQAIYQRRN